jgi:hypothetical protein
LGTAYIHGMWLGVAYIHGMWLGTAYIHGILLTWQMRAAAWSARTARAGDM